VGLRRTCRGRFALARALWESAALARRGHRTELDVLEAGHLAQRLPPGAPILAKQVFGLANVPEILAAVQASGRRTAILVGAETDVCVAQSAIGLRDRGFRVVVVTDATFSPSPMHDLGLRRVREAGVGLHHAKGVYYEWIQTLEAARTFRSEHPELADPPGFRL